MPRTRDMGRIHLIAGSADIARRRRLVPPGHLVEAWQDLRIPDRFWVGDEAKALQPTARLAADEAAPGVGC